LSRPSKIIKAVEDCQGRRRLSRPSKIVKAVEDRQGRRRSSRPSKIVKIVKIVTGFTGRNALTALNIFWRKQLLQHIQHKLRTHLELLPLPAQFLQRGNAGARQGKERGAKNGARAKNGAMP